jgi:hypothetical protein
MLMRLVETYPLLNGIRVDMLFILFDHLAARLHTVFVLLLQKNFRVIYLFSCLQ